MKTRTVSCWTVLKDKLCITRLVTCIGSSPLTTGVIFRPVITLRPVNLLSASNFWNGHSFSCEIHCGKQLLVWCSPAASFAGTQGARFSPILLLILVTSVKYFIFTRNIHPWNFFSFKFLMKWLFAFKNPHPTAACLSECHLGPACQRLQRWKSPWINRKGGGHGTYTYDIPWEMPG